MRRNRQASVASRNGRLTGGHRAALIESLETRVLLAGAPVGGTFLASPVTGLINAYYPDVAFDGAGNHVVVWSQEEPENPRQVWAQRYGAAGNALGAAWQVDGGNTAWSGTVAMAPNGSFVISWETAQTVWARRYAPSGAAQGPAIIVSTQASTGIRNNAVAMADDGHFAVSWTDSTYGLHARVYEANGTPRTGDLRVDTVSGSTAQNETTIAMDADGDFAIAWTNRQSSIGDPDVKVRRYNAAGEPQGVEFVVHNSTPGSQQWADVAMTPAGEFVVVWRAYGTGADGIYFQKFTATGAAQGSQTLVEAGSNQQQPPRVAVDPVSGEFTVVWSDFGVRKRRFTAAGAATSGTVVLNSMGQYDWPYAEVDMDAQGNALVVWSDRDPTRSVSSVKYAIFGQRFAGVFSGASVGGVAWDDIDGDGIRGAGEPVRSGVMVKLYSEANVMADVATTGANGRYSFLSVVPGERYYVQASLPTGLAVTQKDRGGDDALDSDLDTVTLRTALFAAPAAGVHLTGIDVGYAGLGTLTGVVFHDLDADGFRDAGEQPLEGWKVFDDVDQDGVLDAGEASGTTSTSGYSLTALSPGPHLMSVVPQSGWTLAGVPGSRTYTVTPGQTTINGDVGVSTAAPMPLIVQQGTEFRVNTTTPGAQSNAALAQDSAGNLVAVWHGPGAEGLDIFAQRFDAAGAPVGAEFRVNTYTAGDQVNPVAALDDDGDLIVAWQSPAQDGSGSGIFMQRYRGDAPFGGESRLNVYTGGNQRDPAISINASGDFAVTWISEQQNEGVGGVYARRFTESTNSFSDELKLSGLSVPGNQPPAVSLSADGILAAAWVQTSGSLKVMASRFDAAGQQLGSEVQVNTTTAIELNQPAIAVSPGGAFVVAWAHRTPDRQRVMMQWFDATGAKVGGEVQANPLDLNGQAAPALSTDAQVSCVLALQSYRDGSLYGIYAMRFAPGGVRQGNELRVNTWIAGDQIAPAVVMSPDGDFTIAWTSDAQDGSLGGIYAQRYERLANPASIGGIIWNDLDGDGIRDAGEPGRGGVSVSLRSANGILYESQLTALDGRYLFRAVRPDETVRISLQIPAGAVPTFRDVGADDSIDSELDALGRFADQSGAAGSQNLALDGGLVAAAGIGGTWFNDFDADGVADAGETGISGRLIYLDRNANGQLDPGELTSSTLIGGAFSFGNLLPGLYLVRDTAQPGWTATTPPRTVTLAPGEFAGGLGIGARTATPNSPLYEVGGPLLGGGEWVASSPDGYSVMVWSSSGTVMARRYDDMGAALGPAFEVAAGITGAPAPRVAMAADRGFVVAWRGSDGVNVDVFARRFDPLGAPRGDAFRVNSFTPGTQTSPSVAMDAAGGFVVAWESDGQTNPDTAVYARRYSHAGAALGDEFLVNPGSTRGVAPSLAMAADGRFVCAWSAQAGGANALALARVFGADGAPLGSEFAVSLDASAAQSKVAASMNDLGQFAVAWWAAAPAGGTVLARRFDAAGVPIGGDIAVAPVTQQAPFVAMDSTGAFTIAWGGAVRRYNSAGVPQSPDMLLVSGVRSMAVDGDGDLVVAWIDAVQRFSLSPPRTMVSGRVWFDMNANGTRDGDGIINPGDPNDYDEFTLDGVTVQLLDAAGQIALSTLTRGGGFYTFANFRAGQVWHVTATAPGNYVATLRDVGADETRDSDIDPATGWSAPINLQLGQALADLDIGGAIPGSISGVRFVDLDADGLRGPGEPGLSDRVLYLDADADGEFDSGEVSVISDSTGAFVFANLRQGTYQIAEVPQPLWTASATPAPVFLPTAQHLTGVLVGGYASIPRLESAPVGVVQIANTTTADRQVDPHVGVDAAGNFVVTWHTINSGGGYFGVFARRFDPQGQPLTPELRVDTGGTASGYWHGSEVLVEPDGDFVVLWNAWTDNTAEYDVFARRYSAAGTALGLPFRINSRTALDQSQFEAVLSPAGEMLVAWQEATNNMSTSEIYARRFASDGTPVGDDFLVNTTTAQLQVDPAVAWQADGAFVITWTSYSQDGSGAGVFGQRFDAGGARIGGEFRVNNFTTGSQHRPAMASDAAGRFVVVWESIGQDGSGGGVYGQRFAPDASPIGLEFRVNAIATGDQAWPSVAMDAAGDIFIAWVDGPPNTTTDDGTVYLRQYNIAGVAETDALLTPGRTTLDDAALAMFPGGAVLAWSNSRQAGADTYFQRYARFATPITSGLPDITVDLDAPDSVIPLYPRFYDADHPDTQLAFTVQGNTLPGLFASVGIDASGQLILNYAPTAIGTSQLTIRATDPGGRFVDARFNVTINPVLRGTAGPDGFTLRRVGGLAEVTVNSLPYTFPTTLALTIDGGEGDDTLVIDLTGTDALPLVSLTFADTLGVNRVVLSSDTAGAFVPLSGAQLQFAGPARLEIAAQARIQLTTGFVLESLSLGPSGRLAMLAGPAATLDLGSLHVEPGGALDLANSAMRVRGGAEASVFDRLRQYLRSGFTDGTWNGVGIHSSTAAAHPSRGLSPALVRTPAGDARITVVPLGDINVDGRVDVDDYFVIDLAYARNQATGWSGGDLDYGGGSPDADDYALIDRGFLIQGGAPGPLSDGGPSPADVPSFTLAGAGSGVEGGNYTLTLSANTAVSSWTVDWGDGSVETFPGSQLVVTHPLHDGPSALGVRAVIQADGVRCASTPVVQDMSFGVAGVADISMDDNGNDIRALAVQNDGKLLVVGNDATIGNYAIGVRRFDANGALDPTFGTGGRFVLVHNTYSDWYGTDITLMEDGRMLVVGGGHSIPYGGEAVILRLNPNGTRDFSFNQQGWRTIALGPFASFRRVLIQPDGRILAGGYCRNASNQDCLWITRLLPDGRTDESFGVQGSVTVPGYPSLLDMILLDDGRIVASLRVNAQTFCFNSDGSVSTGFGTSGVLFPGLGDCVDLVAVPGNKFLISAGSSIARFDGSGVLDPTFGTAGVRTGGGGPLALMRDGTIATFTGDSSTQVQRFLSNGAVDPRLTAPIPLISMTSQALAVRGDGAIYLAGAQPTHQNVARAVRITTDAHTVLVSDVTPQATVCGPASLNEGQAFTLSLGVVDPGIDRVSSWTIDWGDGFLDDLPGNPSSAQHVYLDNGQYRIRALFRDEDGAYPAPPLAVVVHNVAPSINLPGAVQVAGPLALNGSFADPGVDLWTATVDCGDGSGPRALALRPDKTFTLERAYLSPGQYVLRVTLRDIDGAIGTHEMNVQVEPAGPLAAGNLFSEVPISGDVP